MREPVCDIVWRCSGDKISVNDKKRILVQALALCVASGYNERGWEKN